MALSNAPDRDVVLSFEEQVAWDHIERRLREGEATRARAVLGFLRHFGWGFVLSFASLYLPPDQVLGRDAF